MEKIIVGLIKGRHEMPVQDYIFDEVQDVMDFEAVRKHILGFLENTVGVKQVFGCGLNQVDYTDVELVKGCKKLVVYVTGLTSVTAELIRCCALNGICLSLMHYDRDTDDYREQVIF